MPMSGFSHWFGIYLFGIATIVKRTAK